MRNATGESAAHHTKLGVSLVRILVGMQYVDCLGYYARVGLYRKYGKNPEVNIECNADVSATHQQRTLWIQCHKTSQSITYFW